MQVDLLAGPQLDEQDIVIHWPRRLSLELLLLIARWDPFKHTRVDIAVKVHLLWVCFTTVDVGTSITAYSKIEYDSIVLVRLRVGGGCTKHQHVSVDSCEYSYVDI